MTRRNPKKIVDCLDPNIFNSGSNGMVCNFENIRSSYDVHDLRSAYDKGRGDQMEECLRWLDQQDEGGMGGLRDLMWKGMRGPKEPIPLFLQLSDAVYFEEWEKVAQLAKKLKKKQQKENK